MEFEKFRIDWGLSGQARAVREDDYIWLERLDFSKSEEDEGFYTEDYRQLSFNKYMALLLAGQIVEGF